MKLNHLNDRDLLCATKNLVQDERQTLTKILHHLREIDRRRLYSELGYSSLFEYAVKELQYSEGQAGRRIQAMRLIKEFPEVERKIASGELNLTNVAQAQNFFREIAKSEPAKVLQASQKLSVLRSLENKSTREGQRELLKLSPMAALPKERERVVSEEYTEIKLLASRKLKAKLEEVRSLAGPKGATMSIAELLEYMAEIAGEALRIKKFGKKVVPPTPAPELGKTKTSRYIPRGLKRQVYERDGHKCVNCGSKKNLQIDHVKPFSLGGPTVLGNLRLACFPCNQRAGIKTFGVEVMERKGNFTHGGCG